MSLDTIITKYRKVISSGIKDTPTIFYSTGIYSLDTLLGGKGFKGGKIVQFLAENKSGKTTLAYSVIAQAQKKGLRCAVIDYERSHDPDYATILGVDNESLLRVTTTYMDDAAELAETMIETGELSVLVIDSVPAAMHSTEREKSMTDSERMTGTAGDWTRHLKRLVPLADDTGTLVILINQWRSNISPMARTEKKPWGARYIQYASSYTLDMSRIKNEDGKATVQVHMLKNKCAATEGHKVDLTLQHGYGFRVDLDILDNAIEHNIVQKRGAWYEYNGIKAQGEENAAISFPIEEIKLKLEGK